MSTNLSNAEIENVLSSIRDLVSEVSVEPAPRDSASTSRLLLTPQQRVDIDPFDEMDAEAGTIDGGHAEAEKTYQHDQPDPLMLTPAQMEEGAAVYEAAQKITPVRDTAAQEAIPDDAATDETPEDAAPAALSFTHRPGRVPPLPGERDRIAESLENRIAELEEAVGRSHEEWEPDGSEENAAPPPGRRLFEVVENTNYYPGNDDSAKRAERPAPLRLADAAFFSEGPQAGGSKPRGENLPFRTSDGVDFGGSDDDPLSPIFGGSLLDDDDDDLFIDEEVLRRVVRDVVQQELQGKLGERMTRNLRRLVRREIERSLTIRELDKD